MSYDQTELATSLKRALTALRQGDLETANGVCADLLQKFPEDPAVHQLAATIALERGDPVAALESSAISLERRPDHVPTLIVEARAMMLLDRLGEAVTILRRASSLDPDRAEPAFLLCRNLLEIGDSEANPLLQQLLERFPRDPSGWRLIGDALYRAKKPKAALVAYTRAMAAEPSSPLQIRRGTILQLLDRLTEAQAAFRDAEVLAPGTVEPILKLGLCLKAGNDHDGAIEALTRAVQLDPTRADAWFALGLVEQDQGHHAEAMRAYRRALSENPTLAEAAVNLGICLQAAGDLPSAKEAYRSALRLRADTFGRISQALASSPTGEVWLDQEALRASLLG